jgi:hypothetical protein
LSLLGRKELLKTVEVVGLGRYLIEKGRKRTRNLRTELEVAKAK